MNGSLPSNGLGDDKIPLVPLRRSPKEDGRLRARALSQLSLQSEASDVVDMPDGGDEDDEPVGMATLFDCTP